MEACQRTNGSFHSGSLCADSEADPDNPQGLNRYTYVGNNPLNVVDPSGHFEVPSIFWSGVTVEQTSWTWGPELAGGTTIITFPLFGLTLTDRWVNGHLEDDKFVPDPGLRHDYSYSFGPPPVATPPPASPPPPSLIPVPIKPSDPGPPPAASGASVLSIVTKAASIVAMLPVPGVSTIAGIVELGGNLLQGDWKAAAWSGATMAASMWGAGAAVKAAAMIRAAKYAKYEVGLAKDLRKVPQLFTEVNHVPQTAQARSLIGDYKLVNKVGNEPAIRLPKSEHLRVNKAQAARPRVPASARELLAQDIKMLRNNTQAPNSALQKLIQMNKELHPTDFTKY